MRNNKQEGMLTHVDSQGNANKLKKGDVLSIAQIAGIQAAKQTPLLIPLCHTEKTAHFAGSRTLVPTLC